MVFKRRTPKGWLQMLWESVWPRGGWGRATSYAMHRLRRLPDPPHRIARGMFAGLFIGTLPLPGAQLAGALLLAWVMRGNFIAAALGTFWSNPVTTPLIAVPSIALGHWMLGIERPLSAPAVMDAFAQAGGEIWRNLLALFGRGEFHWDALQLFMHDIYWPYFVGSIAPGIAVGLIGYYISLPVVRAYQGLRAKRLRERIARRLARTGGSTGGGTGGGPEKP
jgi:uncharacterized protein (DUF2062 family)